LNCIPYQYYNNVIGIPWDGTGINCYGMEMGQINMSHGQPWDRGRQTFINEGHVVLSVSSEGPASTNCTFLYEIEYILIWYCVLRSLCTRLSYPSTKPDFFGLGQKFFAMIE